MLGMKALEMVKSGKFKHDPFDPDRERVEGKCPVCGGGMRYENSDDAVLSGEDDIRGCVSCGEIFSEGDLSDISLAFFVMSL